MLGCGRRLARAAGKRFRQANELGDLPDFFRERFPRKLLPHFQFHNVGSFRLCLCSTRITSDFFGSAVVDRTPRRKCCHFVAALLPFLLPFKSFHINDVTDVASFQSYHKHTIYCHNH